MRRKSQRMRSKWKGLVIGNWINMDNKQKIEEADIIIHIGIAGPIYLPSLKPVIKDYNSDWPKGMGGVPVNHQIIALLKRGYKVSVYSSSPEIEVNDSFEYHQDNLSIYMGPFRKRARQRMSDFFSQERKFITEAIRRSSPLFIHAHWQYEWAWGALDSGITTLVTCHDAPFQVLKAQPDLYRLFRLFMAAIVLRKSKFLTTVSPYCAKGLKIFTRKDVKVIPNFEPDYVFSLYDENKSLNDRVKIALINNGFTKLKNVIKGIESFCLYQEYNPDAELHLYGSGHNMHGDAYQWCEKNAIDLKQIIFHGEVPFSVLMKELSTMDIFLHPSLEESFGMVLVEAMAMGIPVVAGGKSGGPEWILKDGGGILVDITDSESILSALIRLSDRDTYWDCSKKARKIAFNRFSEQLVFEMYLEAYAEIVKNKLNGRL